jgi:competence protein ComEA
LELLMPGKSLAALTAFVAINAFAAIDVNKATLADLESVTGLGPATTSAILDERRKGSFKDWADLIGRVKGVGEHNAARLSAEGLTVGGASYKGVEAKKSRAEGQPRAADAAASTSKK